MTLRLRTFGAVFLERDGRPLTGAHSQKRRLALLAYLAAAGKGGVPRDRLLAMLWPESDAGSARHSLSQLLYSVRQDLGNDVVATDAESVRLNHDTLGSDVKDFDEHVRADRLDDAVALHLGPFLDGFHVGDMPDLDRWIEEERARRTSACARALDRLADGAERTGDAHGAADWMRQRVFLDPADTRATLRLMRALSAIGDSEGAVRAGRSHEAFVRTQLDVEPDAAILDFVSQLRANRQQRATTPPPQKVVAAASTAPSPGAMDVVAVPPARSWSPGDADRRAPTFVRRHWLAAVSAILIVAVVAVVSTTRGSSSRNGDAMATVVLGDLKGPDTVLALALREALRAELVNTPGVQLTSDQGVRELKTLMRLPPGMPLRGSELLALATRTGAHVAVTGSVVPIGDGAQIVLELLDPESGQTVETFTERPTTATTTLEAVGRVARAIGAAVSRQPPNASVRPLPTVTTASLAALKSYALARQTAAAGFRREAVAPGELAVTHDSSFVLAHYFLGDLLWFIDEQTHSDAHLTKAFELLSTVPLREQLVIKARYQQLVRDDPDSALAYWQLVSDAWPGDVMAYEGRTWALRALGRYEEAAAYADKAMKLDPGSLLPNLSNAIYSWFSVGDTATALEIATRVAQRYPAALIEARFFAALFGLRADAMAWALRAAHPQSRHYRTHMAQVASGDVAGARVTLDSVLRDSAVQMPPNTLLNQGWLELTLRGDTAAAARYARRTLDWTRHRDLSPPAIGRLTERIADLAARAGDLATVRATIDLVRDRDRGRSLRTYVMTLRALEAALAYAQRDYARAATLAEEARHGVYFSRSLATLALLEADARRLSGDTAAADSLEHLVDSHQIVDGNFEVWAVLRALRRLDSATPHGG
ncbi:MAG: BTAD domain-containing putative transcriptional regulator [Gemmatimonadaceae bacterium]